MLSNRSTLPFTQFAIYGLYGDRNIIIPFNQAIKILVSENGVGKTTVLNALYAVLTSQFFKLASLEFDKIVLAFPNDEITIHQSDLVPTQEESVLLVISQKINQLVQEEILYFPAYRQRKENLSHLGDFPASPDHLFQSSMNEVKTDIERIVLDIKELVVGWALALASKEPLFTPVRTGFANNGINIDSLADSKMLMECIGDTISKNGIEMTLKIIDFSKSEGLAASTIADFLSNTVEMYYQEQKKQNALKAFIKVCNRYLVDKQFVYHDKSVETEMVLTKNNRPITLEKLSSGEKQIVSIFSKLYLTLSPKNIVIFDEPELSISMEWQEMLLPNVFNSPQCQGIIAATHSPFIFNNALNANTVDLNEYIEEIESC